jgi:Ser/Thr protein kinase RdoA (MazF antagonist)
MNTFDFSGLTPALILDAIESQGTVVESGLLALNSYENRVYQFVAADKKRYVAKFYRPQRWSHTQIQEEHDFSIELASQGIPVVAPLMNRPINKPTNKSTNEPINKQSLHIYKGFYFALFPSAAGRQFEADNLDHIKWMGRVIGRIHTVAKNRDFEYRPTLNIKTHLLSPLQALQDSSLLPLGLHTAFFTILQQIVDLTASLYINTNNIRLHGDCHPGNILWHDGPTFVDLDDCKSGPAIQDLWMMLSGDRQQQLVQMQTIIAAYEESCAFDKAQLKLIEPLRAMRMVRFMAWLAKRWQDPAFPQAFPWFAHEKYWEQQVLALKEQLTALQEPPLTL